jgi:hypothetical protein
MTNEEVNRTIHEARGLCWHEWPRYIDTINGLRLCVKCKVSEIGKFSPDYYTPEGFIKAWDWAKEQEWWSEFVEEKWDIFICDEKIGISEAQFLKWFTNRDTFATVLAEFIQKRTHGTR